LQNKLWQCPIKVKRGTYEEMPESWIGAVVNYYVGAPTYEDALTKAVTVLKSQGMEFVDLLEGKVYQIDPTEWWEGHVMKMFAEYSDYFPDQETVLEVVAEGSLFHGPFAGWETE
jgi:hypothetical protein